MSTLTVSRQVTDWVGVIQALDAMGWNEPLIERIRAACKEHGLNAAGPVTMVFEGRDVAPIDLATNFADTGRPDYFPPVSKEVIT
jgi:hypothetical protein